MFGRPIFFCPTHTKERKIKHFILLFGYFSEKYISLHYLLQNGL